MKAELNKHKVVSEADWLKARKKLLVKEKKFLRLEEELSLERRGLPWVKVTKDYVFEGPILGEEARRIWSIARAASRNEQGPMTTAACPVPEHPAVSPAGGSGRRSTARLVEGSSYDSSRRIFPP